MNHKKILALKKEKLAAGDRRDWDECDRLDAEIEKLEKEESK